MVVQGNFVDIEKQEIYQVIVTILDGTIQDVIKVDDAIVDGRLPFLLPGFIDAHVHIESSMLIPAQFARISVVHGTVATVSDPHEIANVCGMEGVDFMIKNGSEVPFKFYFGAPSCVPATIFETAGAALDAKDVETLLKRPEVHYLSEMMNFPGVLNKDPEVMKKIEEAKALGKPIDGHAPGLRGEDAQAYIDAGMSTDHECFTYDEALEKLRRGMKIIIREGSAAKNFDALIPLIEEWHEQIMFCSDDKHPDSLALGHINQLCARAVAKGFDVFKVLKAACVNPVLHYKLHVGQLRIGDPADFIVVKDLKDFEVLQTYIDGNLVADQGQSLIKNDNESSNEPINRFTCKPVTPEDFLCEAGDSDEKLPVIEALDGQLITNRLNMEPKTHEGQIIADVERDILKIAVINRYYPALPAVSFIRNFGLKRGALASSVAHDSHNIVVVGCDDESMALAANVVIEAKGGICATEGEGVKKIALPVAGLMTFDDGYNVASDYTALDTFAKEKLGSKLSSPFMTLSFMALLVIPHLKLSDKGLFDGDSFSLLYTS